MVDSTLKNITAFITGASRGIGYSIAHSLAKRGANIILVARTLQPILHAYQKLSKFEGQHLYISADIGNPQQVQDAVTRSLERYGRIDILVNNAGIFPYGPIEKLSEEEISDAINVNFRGPVNLYRALIPHFQQQCKGKVIDVISLAAFKAYSGNAVYGGTKYAHRATSLSEAADNPFLDIYRLYPSVTDTSLVRENLTPEKKAIFVEGQPRINSDDIGELVAKILLDPSTAKTHDIKIVPRELGSRKAKKIGSMAVTFVKRGYMEIDKD